MPPTWRGKAKTARSPAARAAGPNSGQRSDSASARSGTSTGRPVVEASTHGSAPNVNCSSSNCWAPPSLAATVPAGPSSVINASPTPLTGTARRQSPTKIPAESAAPRESARTAERISATLVDAVTIGSHEPGGRTSPSRLRSVTVVPPG